jgi:hypothetical protein
MQWASIPEFGAQESRQCFRMFEWSSRKKNRAWYLGEEWASQPPQQPEGFTWLCQKYDKAWEYEKVSRSCSKNSREGHPGRETGSRSASPRFHSQMRSPRWRPWWTFGRAVWLRCCCAFFDLPLKDISSFSLFSPSPYFITPFEICDVQQNLDSTSNLI